MNIERIRPLIKDILGDGRLVAADVGARYDVPKPWLVLDGIAHFVSFEPDAEACKRLEKTYAARGHGEMYTVRPVALTGSGGDRTLYITGMSSGSSLFDPDRPVVREHVNHDYLFPVRTQTIPTQAARAEFEAVGETDVDLMKLDIQGCELDVLEGLGADMLQRLLCVELEAAIRPRGNEFPTFAEIHALLTGHGFELVNLWPLCTHRTLDGHRDNYLHGMLGVRRRSPSVSARAWEADMLYTRSYDSLFESGQVDKVLKLAICLGVYGYYIESLHLVAKAAEHGMIDADRAEHLQRCVVQWHHHAHFRPWHGAGWLGNAYEWLLRRLNLSDLESSEVNLHRG